MSAGALQTLLKEIAVLSFFLLIGMVLRAKVKFFRNMLLPASVIGGFLALLVGPQVWGAHPLLPIPQEYITSWSNIPGVLIVPIFAAVPLGSGLVGESKKTRLGESLFPALMAVGIFSSTSSGQSLIGFFFNVITTRLGFCRDLYPVFGGELSQGFAGGHGTAAGYGSILQGYGVPYWELAQAVATTFATVGLMGGMILGIAMINRAANKGQTKILKSASELPFETAQGYSTDISAQPMIGRETTNSSSIEVLTTHLSIILLVSALAYWGLEFSKSHGLTGFDSIPVWFYALLIMYAVNFALKKLKLGWMVDSKVRSRITGCMSDYAITAAIASMPIKAVAAYVGPIAILCIFGFVYTYVWSFVLMKWMFGKENYSFERGIINWGTGSGVMINGMMLLKICDPDYETPALTDFSAGWAIMSVVSIVTSPITYSFLKAADPLNCGLWASAMWAGWLAVAFVARSVYKKSHTEFYS